MEIEGDKVLASIFNNPLNIAISRNDVESVQKLLHANIELAEVQDLGSSPLHFAAARGNIEIVRALIEASMSMCFARDQDGRNPVHIAAIKGRVEVLKELVGTCPHAARMKVEKHDTIFHLCVKHGQLETLELLMGMDFGDELVNAKDSGGDTILHLAVYGKIFDILQFLLSCQNKGSFLIGFDGKRKRFDINTVNTEGHTALDIVQLTGNRYYEKCLLKSNSKKANDMRRPDWFMKRRDTLMVVASLTAVMAFQAAVSPPAGFWQDDRDGHGAGEAVMAYNYPDLYPYFYSANSISFITSLSSILLLIGDLPFKNRFCTWILVLFIWLSITSTAITYGFSIIVVTPKKDGKSLSYTIMGVVLGWCFFMHHLLMVHTGRLIKDANNDMLRKSRSVPLNRYEEGPRTPTSHNSITGTRNSDINADV